MQDVPAEMGESGVSEQWREDAACKDTDVETFFPEKGSSTWSAKRLCAICPVTAECLRFSLDNHEQHGVWGGVAARERVRMMTPWPTHRERLTCNAGHSLLNPANARVLPDGRRECRLCARERRRARRAA